MRIIFIILCLLPSSALAGQCFLRRHCNTYGAPQVVQTRTIENNVIVQNNLYIPGTIKAFKFVDPGPENPPEPLRQFEFEPNIPEHQPRRLSQIGEPHVGRAIEVSPFIIQNIVTTTSGTVRVFNQGKEVVTTSKVDPPKIVDQLKVDPSKVQTKPSPRQSPKQSPSNY